MTSLPRYMRYGGSVRQAPQDWGLYLACANFISNYPPASLMPVDHPPKSNYLCWIQSTFQIGMPRILHRPFTSPQPVIIIFGFLKGGPKYKVVWQFVWTGPVVFGFALQLFDIISQYLFILVQQINIDGCFFAARINEISSVLFKNRRRSCKFGGWP